MTAVEGNPTKCATCSADIEEYQSVCPQCGTSRISQPQSGTERVAGLDQAVVFLPNRTLDRLPPLPGANPLKEGSKTDMFSDTLPYRWGVFCAWSSIVIGGWWLLLGIWAIVNGGEQGIAGLVLGAFSIWLGMGIHSKARWALYVIYVSTGISVIAAAFGFFVGHPEWIFDLISLPSTYYFYKRSDEFS